LLDIHPEPPDWRRWQAIDFAALPADDPRNSILPIVVHEWFTSPMTTPRQLKAVPSNVPAPFTPNPAPTTLEQAGLHPGSRFIADAEEQERIDAEERQRLDANLSLLDVALQSAWSCKACGANAFGSQAGLCASCAVVVHQLRAEQAMHDDVDGRTRRELVERYLSEQS
jgi:hypothetical protein